MPAARPAIAVLATAMLAAVPAPSVPAAADATAVPAATVPATALAIAAPAAVDGNAPGPAVHDLVACGRATRDRPVRDRTGGMRRRR